MDDVQDDGKLQDFEFGQQDMSDGWCYMADLLSTEQEWAVIVQEVSIDQRLW